jgi:hypothetical protein
VWSQEPVKPEFYNLPLVLAYSSLDEVLTELAGQGVFTFRARAMLGEKMKASRNALPWMDYAEVEAGRIARNAIAHDGELLDREECFRFIAAIQAEFVAWGILDAAAAQATELGAIWK